MRERLRRISGVDPDTAAIWWKDGGMQIKIDGKWWVRWDNRDYVPADKDSSRLYEEIINERQNRI